MEQKERDHIVEWLVAMTGYNRSVFDKMTDTQVIEMFEEKMQGRYP